MERVSWQVHFRNRYIIRRDWRQAPVSGTIEWAGLAGFLFGNCRESGSVSSMVQFRIRVPSRQPTSFATEQRSALRKADQRPSTCTLWIKFGVGNSAGALQPALPGLHASAIAQTEARLRPRKQTQASATHPTTQAKAKHPTADTQPRSALQPRLGAQDKSKTPGKKGSKQVARKRGQQAIGSERAREIQTALIREHYMQGEPSGHGTAPRRPRCSAIRPIRDGSRRRLPIRER